MLSSLNVITIPFLVILFSATTFAKSDCEPVCSEGKVCRNGNCISNDSLGKNSNFNLKQQEYIQNNRNPYIRPIVQLILGPLFTVVGTGYLVSSIKETSRFVKRNDRIQGIAMIGISFGFDIWTIAKIEKRKEWKKNHN
jgi:hypothetical protein